MKRASFKCVVLFVVLLLGAVQAVENPNPIDGSTVVPGDVELSWTNLDQAISVDVYFTTDKSVLEFGTEEELQPIKLVSEGVDVNSVIVRARPGTQYYWAVDTYMGDPNAPIYGSIFSFTTEDLPPEVVETVSPLDGAVDVNTTGLLLEWEAGQGAINYDVYFGTDAADLGMLAEDLTETSYLVPQLLTLGQTYYWRVDANDGSAVYAGWTASFTTTAPAGSITWTNDDPQDNLWSTAGNWTAGLPGVGTTVNIINEADACVIDANTEAYCTKLNLGTNVADVECQLNVTGGLLTVEGELLMSRDLGSLSTLRISGGVVNCGFLRGWLGDMWVIQTGGEFNVTGTTDDPAYMEIPRSYASAVGTVGLYRLDDGICRVGTLILNANPDVNCQFDITKGKLILNGDKRSQINGYVADGLITAYDGLETASISTAYDDANDKTIVIACEKAWQADFNADCIVDEKDRALLVAALGDTTMPEALWDFDMSTDPVGPGFWDLVIRQNKDSYIIGSGVMTLPGGDFTLDTRPHRDVCGSFDMDLRIVAKSTSTAPIRVWFPIESSATPGTYALPHTTQYLDGATQTVTISNGAYWWVGDYAPLVLTGFASDAFVDLSIQCDQDTDSLVYTVTDGTKTETGTWNYISSGGGGDGGDWTLLTDAGGTGVIDHLTVKVHGTHWNSPFDINLDGTVDQLDLDILEAEMAQ